MGRAAIWRGVLVAAALVLVSPAVRAQSDGVIDTQEEYAAAAAGVQAVYDAGDWAAAVDHAGAFADFAETFFGPGHPEPLHYRSLQVFALERLARWDDVLAVADRALRAADAAGPVQPASIPMRIDIGGSLGRALFADGQNERALAVAEGVIAQAEAAFGPESMEVVVHRLDRARAANAIGDADQMARTVEDFAFVGRVAGALPEGQGHAAAALREGAAVLLRLGRPREAGEQLAQAVPMLERLYGPEAQDTLRAMLERVDAMAQTRDPQQPMTPDDLTRFSDAFGIALDVAARAERTYGASSPLAAEAMALQGWLLLTNGGGILGEPGLQLGVVQVGLGLEQMERALPEDDPRLVRWRLAWLAILGKTPNLTAEQARRGVDVARAAVRQRAAGLAAVAVALQVAERAGALTPDQAAEQALFAVQELQFGMAPAVMGFWQRRLEQGSGPVHDLHRAFTDTTLKGRALEADLLALLAQPLANRDPAAQAEVEAALAVNRAEGDRLAGALGAQDPTFGANFAGSSLSVAEIRALIGPDEAVVVAALPDVRAHDAAGVIVAVSHDAIAWAPLNQPPGHYLESVAALREAVQLHLGVRAAISLAQEDAAEPRRVTFAPDAAHRLYADTLGKVTRVTAGKAHLYLDLRGPLALLPPHLMLVTLPAADDPADDTLAGADWLIRHHALTVIASVTSLRTVALARQAGRAPKAYLAFGNPDFGAATTAVPGLDALRRGLAPLPETADEVRRVAQSLGAGDAALRLAGQASEAALKSADLGEYRVLHFATHGLLSGDGAGGTDVLGEPALALTPGQDQDGFLRASEVLDLRLNADLVVLSACNTALGGPAEDEALAGLAQAFLYAGTKALLVSHWPVESRSAARLMTDTFALQAADPTLSMAQAQRRAILDMIDNPPDPRWSHPAYWAPFVLVGGPD